VEVRLLKWYRVKDAKRIDGDGVHRLLCGPTGHAWESKCTAKKRGVAAFVELPLNCLDLSLGVVPRFMPRFVPAFVPKFVRQGRASSSAYGSCPMHVAYFTEESERDM
jgi:hypothetical protein